MPEQQSTHHERGHESNRHELEAAAAELQQAKHEKKVEISQGQEKHEQLKRAEAAREAIHGPKHKEAEPQHEVPQAEAQPTPPPIHHHVAAMLNHHLNYAQTLASVQRRLTPASRSFSRFIHTPAIEKASEALESTVARPSVMAGSTWTALIIGSVFYFTARRYGYNLSGSEIDVSFLLGAALGLLLEWLWRTFLRRPRRH